ncbi:AcrR family transcriptional regulator [Pseudomonas sp. F-14 TE3623]|uniref:TetR/AcrR family transcriptional regulator n=1 Tax=Pseudomonas farris TaxID=2841207 RepID=A0ABS6PTQ4_9PSED|nr:TetR/AcrR family transcriptional regulator [Pseudomonas farris]MBV4463855.1 TetR/AcrR family transcriptional regulator [Pseudomonas farris]
MADRGRPRNFDREKSLAKAMELFWEKGYEGASMAELTATMGIGSPSLYAAFGSKEGLFREAVDLYRATDGAAVWQETLAATSAYGAVEAFLMSSAREFSRIDKPSGCFIILSALHSTQASAAVGADVSAKRARNVEILAEKLAQGVQSGEIDEGVNVEAVARFLITVQQGMSIQARDGARRQKLEEIAHSALVAWQALTRDDSLAQNRDTTVLRTHS